MTDKRFAVTQTILGSGIYDFQAENELCESYDEDAYNEVVRLLNKLHEENKELKRIKQDYISSLEEEKNNLQIKLRKIRDYAMEDGEVKQGVIEKVMRND